MANVIARIPILFQSVQPAIVQQGVLYSNFSEAIGAPKSFMWSDARAGERIVVSPARFSQFSKEINRSTSNLWNGVISPEISMGDAIKTYPRAFIKPFVNISIVDKSDAIENIDWRVGDNTWNRIDSNDYVAGLKNVSYPFNEIGSVPCQIRAILKTDEVIYSKENYIIVLPESDTEILAYLTSPTDKVRNDKDYSLGGAASSSPLSASSRVVSSGGLSISDENIEVESTLCFPNCGYVSIDGEIISYNHVSKISPYYLKGCVRGLFGTNREVHKYGSNVRLIQVEGLFDNIAQSDLEGDSKVDYKCICVRNIKDIETGDISIYSPWAPNSEENGQKISIAIERSVSGNSNFSQEIVNKYAEPMVSQTDDVKILNIAPTIFLWEDYVDSKLLSDGFGFISKNGISSSDNYIYLSENVIEGEAIYRLFSNSLVTVDRIKYNSSSADGSSIIISYRYGNTIESISSKEWVNFEIENHEVLTKTVREILAYTNIFDIKILLKRKEVEGASPSFGDLQIIFWENGFSRFLKFDEDKISRELSGNNFYNQHGEFHAAFPEETNANLPPLSSNDNYVIQSTFANGVGSSSYVIKFNQSFATSFVSYQDCYMDELTIYEKRIDWDNSSESEIDLTLYAILYDGDPEGGANIIGKSSIELNLTSKVTRSSYRVFSFSNDIKLKKDKKYWFRLYSHCEPLVKGEWRFRGTNDYLYGNPDKNETKIFDYKNGFVKKRDVTDFAIGFVAIGRLHEVLSGHLDRSSTIFYKLSPEGLSDDDWVFNGIELSLSSPYNHPYKIGPFIHVSWRKSGDVRWHRFRPRKISVINGDFELNPPSKYKVIPNDQYVVIRLSIDSFLTSDSREAARGFGELGLGTQPAVSKIKASWSQKVDFNAIPNAVTKWIDLPINRKNAILMSDFYNGWGDSLAPNEQLFVWVKRDFCNVKNPIPYSGFMLVFNHGVESKYDLVEYDRSNWDSISEDAIPDPPAFITLPSLSNNGTYVISWGAVSNASLYELQEEHSPFSTIAYTSNNSYVAAGRENGVYRYRVRAVNSAGSSEWVISNAIVVEHAIIEESSSSSSSSSQSLAISDSSDSSGSSVSSPSSASSASSASSESSTSSESSESSSTINQSTSSDSSPSSTTSSSTVTYFPPLNFASNAVYASGYRRLYDGYTGPLIEIQRSSDSAVMDVYSLANGDIDEEGMALFIGSDDAVVTKLYDQIGINNLRGGLKIAAAGVFYKINGHPTPFFDGLNKFGMTGPSNLPLGSSARTIAVVSRYTAFSSQSFMLTYGSTVSTTTICDFGQNLSGAEILLAVGGANIRSGGMDTMLHQYAWRYDQSEQLIQSELLKDNVSQPLVNTSTLAINTVNGNLVIGGHIRDGYNLTGYIPEVIIFNTSKDLTDIYADQKSYWGI